MGSRKRMEAPASPPVAPLGEVAGQQSNHMLHWDRPLLPDTTQPQLTTEGDEDGIFFVAGMVKYGWYMFYIYVLEKDDNNDVDDTDDDNDMIQGVPKKITLLKFLRTSYS